MSLLDALLLDARRINTWVALRSDGIKGSGTTLDPYNGSGAANFDQVMSSLPEFATVHLGPGTFETRGYSDDVSGAGWQVKKGMKLAFSLVMADPGLGVSEVVNAGIEECLAVDPVSDTMNVGPMKALHAGGREAAATHEEGFGRAAEPPGC